MPNESNPTNIEKEIPKQFSLLNFLSIISKERKFIIRIWLIAIVTSIIISLLLPKIYESQAVIIPPQNSGVASNLLSSAGSSALMNLTGAIFGSVSSADLYIGILKSRTVAEVIIKRFNLQEVYHTKYLVDTIERLADNTNIKKTKEDMILITVQDKNPQRAADMANAYVEELSKLSSQMGITSASHMRIFLEKRIDETKNALQTAEDRLKEFQIKNKMISLDNQTKAMVDGAAQLEGQLIAAETELGILRSFSTENNVRIKLTRAKIAELKKQISQLERGSHATHIKPTTPGLTRGTQDSFFIPFSQIPDVGLELIRLMREVKIQETVFELLTQQYELAKVNEAKDTEEIQILDTAKIPDKKAKPRRTLIVLTTALISLIGSLWLAYGRAKFNQLNPTEKDQWVNIFRNMFQGLLFWSKRKESKDTIKN